MTDLKTMSQDRPRGGGRIGFARWVFAIAGVYGLIVLIPQYFLEERIGQDAPPAITHPEYFYGFVGLGVVWQIAFLVIALDPPRYRLMMLVGILEKISFPAAVWPLYFLGRTALPVFVFSCLDLALGIMFMIAFFVTPRESK